MSERDLFSTLSDRIVRILIEAVPEMDQTVRGKLAAFLIGAGAQFGLSVGWSEDAMHDVLRRRILECRADLNPRNKA